MNGGRLLQENVQKVIEGHARYDAGERVPEPEFWHQDAEYHASSTDPDSAVHHGIEAIRRKFNSWEEAYPDLRVEPLEVKDPGDAVFAWVRFSGHGASSGMPMEMELAHVQILRDGRIARLAEYPGLHLLSHIDYLDQSVDALSADSAAARTRDTYLNAQYVRIERRRGHSKAIVAVAHSILVAASYILRDAKPSDDLGGDYFRRRETPERLTRHLVRQLERLGQTVTLEPALAAR
jgi:ketosteroid isomerase-like protein